MTVFHHDDNNLLVTQPRLPMSNSSYTLSNLGWSNVGVFSELVTHLFRYEGESSTWKCSCQIALALRVCAILLVFEKFTRAYLIIPNCTRNHVIIYLYLYSLPTYMVEVVNLADLL